ncbi:hypothetical protein GC425_05455 [Corynebacterium sp. zg254]|uniref:TadE-like protein n=1 Tax=Corynebacterium zhongnanshanii TaxID=2768834 RepID=A0ABQ6VE93_9CORY|nr:MULTISPECIES: hypothetical protein [Corynebacterium]KAB3522643.1 hypothetical protein F8377_00150 [Corynebacterium zhongnanshanii]MCR5914311.1 hypothetical protein [Corynebacterium sp. zg254]
MNTIEGAVVLSALTLTAGTLVGGFITLAQHAAVTSLARDAARAEALGNNGTAVVAARSPDARVTVSATTVGDLEAVRVQVTRHAALFDVHGEAVTITEPRAAEPDGDLPRELEGPAR